MNLPKLLLASFLLLPLTQAFSAVYYVSPTGSDENPGSKERSFLTIQKAQTAVSPGDTVYLRGGLYKMAETQVAQKRGIWAYVTLLDKSGSPGKPIRYWA